MNTLCYDCEKKLAQLTLSENKNCFDLSTQKQGYSWSGLILILTKKN